MKGMLERYSSCPTVEPLYSYQPKGIPVRVEENSHRKAVAQLMTQNLHARDQPMS